MRTVWREDGMKAACGKVEIELLGQKANSGGGGKNGESGSVLLCRSFLMAVGLFLF